MIRGKITVEVWICMDLGGYLAEIRNERGYSQRDLAEKCGISAAEICRVENGKRQKPSPAVLRAIADALVISYPYLMQLAGYMEENAEEEPESIGEVFLDEDGRIIDAQSGAREMVRRDAAWANTAFRVSRELSDSDRQILTEMTLSFLRGKREEKEREERERREESQAEQP